MKKKREKKMHDFDINHTSSKIDPTFAVISNVLVQSPSMVNLRIHIQDKECLKIRLLFQNVNIPPSEHTMKKK